MAFAFPSTSSQTAPTNDMEFYSVVDRLKTQNALPQECFPEELPFFNLPYVPKEVQIRELFENSCDQDLCRHLLNNVAPLPEGAEDTLVPQNHSSVSVMSFAQIVLYKVLPCPDSNCPRCPREIATHNQYKDFEYECPFYHHDKDRRRLVIFDGVNEEFVYKANYFEEGRRQGDKDKYSQNYFESMYHPLYYKMFRCKRDFCSKSVSCPFFHSEEEKIKWDTTFTNFIRKDRGSYVKDKQQKTSEKKPRGQEARRKISDDKQNKNRKPFYQHNHYEEAKNNFEKNWKNPVKAYRKDSDSSFEESHGHNNGFFSKLQASSIGYKVY